MAMNFWEKRKVVVTGHTGFKGSWMSLWLQYHGAEVIGYALAPHSDRNLFNAADVAANMVSYTADINDQELLTTILKRHQPSVVIHMAAQSLVQASYEKPIETFVTNIIGTANVLESVRKIDSVKAVVIITTDKCYENQNWPWGYREIDPLGGFDPYSSSKACAEIITASYRDSFFNFAAHSENNVGIATVRGGNVIGGGDHNRQRLIPEILESATKSQPVFLRNPESVRPWQHVLDLISAYTLLAESLFKNPKSFSEAWNFGPSIEDCKQVSWITNFLLERLGNKEGWRQDIALHGHETRTLTLDCSKAREKLSWSPKLSLKQALDLTIDWHLASISNKNMNKFSLDQIDKFTTQV